MNFLLILAWFFVIITSGGIIAGSVILLIVLWRELREIFYFIVSIILMACTAWAVDYLIQYYGAIK